MVKTKNKDTNRLCVTFEHPEILQEFNNYFYKEYGTVRGHRLQVLEDLIQNFNETQTITKNEPEYITLNQDLQRQANTLTTENERLQKEVDTLTNTTQLLQQDITRKDDKINTLTKQVENYNTLNEDNIRLSEEVKKYKNDIANMKDNLKKIDNEIKDKIRELQQARSEYTTLVETHANTINDLTNKHETTINKLTEDHKDEKKELNEERKLMTAYTIKLKDEIEEIKGLNMIDRILKRYPDKTPDIKELPITLENNITDERS